MITINGYMKGTNYDNGTWSVKTLGTADNGAVLCGLNVSGKDKEGNRVYGKSIDVKINVKSRDEAMRVKGLITAGDSMFSCDGFFVPNNWTNKEGKEIKGNQFLVTDSTTFVPFDGQVKPKAKPAPEADITEEELPF